MDAHTTEQLPQLTDRERDNLRTQAAQEREAGNTGVADMLDQLADDGLPRLEDCRPWTEIREELWAGYDAEHDRRHVA